MFLDDPRFYEILKKIKNREPLGCADPEEEKRWTAIPGKERKGHLITENINGKPNDILAQYFPKASNLPVKSTKDVFVSQYFTLIDGLKLIGVDDPTESEPKPPMMEEADIPI